MRPSSLTSRMAWRVVLVLGLMLRWNLAHAPLKAQDLPPDIQVDRFLLEARQQIEGGNFVEALTALDRIFALQSEHNPELPSIFWFRHALVALETGLYAEAKGSATRYLRLTGRGGEDYTAALEVLIEAERWLAAGVFRDCLVCPAMVEVPARSFLMGSPTSEEGRWNDEGPQHRVTISSPFAVGVYEVTFGEWEVCVREGGCEDVGDQGWGRGKRPVHGVSWHDAQGYVRWLSHKSGQQYRLLSEAEWEYVARAGTERARYWGETADAQCRYANGIDAAFIQARMEADSTYRPSGGSMLCSDGFDGPAPVGSFKPNSFGLHDVLGNVSEWTEDCWNDSYVGAPTDGGTWPIGDCYHLSVRVVRGGASGAVLRFLRSAQRSGDQAGVRYRYHGFRLARDIN